MIRIHCLSKTTTLVITHKASLNSTAASVTTISQHIKQKGQQITKFTQKKLNSPDTVV